MKRIISGILALIICLSFTSLICLATDGFAGGSGTKNDPYLISTKAQLDLVQYDLSAHYRLQNDIIFTAEDFASGGAFYNDGKGFCPIGDNNTAFRGSFDGNGKKIANLYIYRFVSNYSKIGLFANNRGEIFELGLENVRIKAECVGGFCTIEVGGIAGENQGQIENCHINGNIQGSSEGAYTDMIVGGIVGQNIDGEIVGCYNEASIFGDSIYGVSVGGLIGLTSGGNVARCRNEGQVSALSVYYEASISAGGIAAIGNNATISDCYNIGTISAVCDTTKLAGTNDATYVGGIVATSNDSLVSACYNMGTIRADASTNHSWAGGIAADNNGTLTYCYNSAKVTADHYAGGIVGDNGGTVAACYNTATVTCENFAGGIAGYHMHKAFDCYNVGLVQGRYAGGIFGERLIGEVQNCYYRDTAAEGTGHGSGDGTNKCTAAQMKNEGTFVGFDFEGEWQFYAAMQPFPVLRALPLHEYDNTCDIQCNSCFLVRDAIHEYGKYIYNNDATADKDGTKTRTCIVCRDTQSVTAQGTKWSNPFKDIKAKDFYYTAVLWAVQKGITTGTSRTTFSPNDPCTRGQIAAFLWRAAGSPKITGKMPFADVQKKDYYYNAVLWAVQKGITTGTSDTAFSPDAPCTRGQIVAFLYREAASPKVDASSPFTDVQKGDYYYKAVLWAVQKGVTTGTSRTTFSPNDPCTRGQIAAFLYRNQK